MNQAKQRWKVTQRECEQVYLEAAGLSTWQTNALRRFSLSNPHACSSEQPRGKTVGINTENSTRLAKRMQTSGAFSPRKRAFIQKMNNAVDSQQTWVFHCKDPLPALTTGGAKHKSGLPEPVSFHTKIKNLPKRQVQNVRRIFSLNLI